MLHPRKHLIQLLGLKYDPFSHVYSEADPAPNFLKVFVDPWPSLLGPLLRPRHNLIFGDYGTGKTATRFAVEYRLRNARGVPRHLSVTYEPRIAQAGEQSPDVLLAQHMAALQSSIATDCLIQLIERLDETVDEPLESQRSALTRLVHLAERALKDKIKAAARASSPMGTLWRGEKAVSGVRPVVRDVRVTARWRQLVTLLAEALAAELPRPSWEAVLQDVRALGFATLYILVDTVDEAAPDPQVIATRITPLLSRAAWFAKQQIVLKMFLPASLHPQRAASPFFAQESLTEAFEIVTIKPATDSDLRRMLQERLELASGSSDSCRSFDELAGPELRISIEDYLIERANGSPRRMLRLLSAFLEYYSIAYKEQIEHDIRPWLDQKHWKEFLDYLERDEIGTP